jgi:hypothetical protein
VIIPIHLLIRNGKSTKTTRGILLNISLKLVLEFFGLVARAEFDDDTGHALGDTLQFAGRLLAIGDLGTLVDGVEWLEIEELDASTSACRITDGLNDRRVDSILVLGTGCISSKEDDVFSREGAICADGVPVDGELVGGQSTGLVRAQDGDTSQLLDSGDTGDDSFVLGELLGTDGEGDREHCGHCNRNTTDQEDKDVVEAATVSCNGIQHRGRISLQ